MARNRWPSVLVACCASGALALFADVAAEAASREAVGGADPNAPQITALEILALTTAGKPPVPCPDTKSSRQPGSRHTKTAKAPSQPCGEGRQDTVVQRQGSFSRNGERILRRWASDAGSDSNGGGLGLLCELPERDRKARQGLQHHQRDHDVGHRPGPPRGAFPERCRGRVQRRVHHGPGTSLARPLAPAVAASDVAQLGRLGERGSERRIRFKVHLHSTHETVQRHG